MENTHSKPSIIIIPQSGGEIFICHQCVKSFSEVDKLNRHYHECSGENLVPGNAWGIYIDHSAKFQLSRDEKKTTLTKKAIWFLH